MRSISAVGSGKRLPSAPLREGDAVALARGVAAGWAKAVIGGLCGAVEG
jgi:hypothetical protein